MGESAGEERRRILRLLAPGTNIREGVERIIRAHRGTLMVVGWSPEIEPLLSGGFVIDSAATAQHVAELAKMDGALVLDTKAERILRANVQLVPDRDVETSETGTRHRSAERTARQTGLPIIAVSESMGVVTLYHGNQKLILEEVSALLARANQALSTLERYRARLDEVAAILSAREIEDTVSVRDVILTLQRAEMMRRIADEVAAHVLELGSEGRLVQLQLDELVTAVADERELIIRDYLADRRRKLDKVLADMRALSTDDLLAGDRVARLMAFDGESLDRQVTPRGYRLLSRIPRLPSTIIDRLVEEFGSLPRVMEATVAELDAVEGIGAARARSIQDGLRRMAEANLLDHYV